MKVHVGAHKLHVNVAACKLAEEICKLHVATCKQHIDACKLRVETSLPQSEITLLNIVHFQCNPTTAVFFLLSILTTNFTAA